MAKFFQVAIQGCKPCGGLFTNMRDAQREVGFLQKDDRRSADEAMQIAGISTPPTVYEIVEVEINL